jgi:hypothetical protein
MAEYGGVESAHYHQRRSGCNLSTQNEISCTIKQKCRALMLLAVYLVLAGATKAE